MVSDRKLYVVDSFKKVLKTVFTDYFKIKKKIIIRRYWNFLVTIYDKIVIIWLL